MKWLVTVLFAYFLLLSSSPARAALTDQELAQAKNTHTTAMASYTSAYAGYDRDRELYMRNGADTYLQAVLASAQTTFTARSQAMVTFNAYLVSLLDNYVEERDAQKAATLRTSLHQQSGQYQALPTNFTARDGLYRADDDFARIAAGAQETIYQSFAVIYYQETAAILDKYTQLYQSQNSRILDEAKTEVEKEAKRRVLEQSGRSLSSLKSQLTTIEADLPLVNSRDQYFTLKTKLDGLVGQLEASLRLYADLE